MPYFLAAAIASTAVIFWISVESFPQARRVAAVFGITSILLLILQGAAWPSLYTIVAILCLPSVFLLGKIVIRPAEPSRPLIRNYCSASLFASALSFALQAWWLAGGCKAVRDCL